MKKHCFDKAEKWKQSLVSVGMEDLVLTILNNGRLSRKTAQYQLASKRAEVVLGSKEACKVIDLHVEIHMQRLQAGLKKQQILFDKFLETMQPHEKHWMEMVEAKDFSKRFTHVRTLIKLQLLSTDLHPTEAKKVLQQIDTKIEEITQLKTFASVKGYFKKLFVWEIDWEEFLWKLCVLLHRDFFAAMVIGWLCYCLVLKLKREPDADALCTEWWENIAYQTCGVPPGEFDWEWFKEVLELEM